MAWGDVFESVTELMFQFVRGNKIPNLVLAQQKREGSQMLPILECSRQEAYGRSLVVQKVF